MRIPSQESMQPVIAADPNQQTYSSRRFYSPAYRYVFLQRLRMALRLMGDTRHRNLLDIGVGSGVFLPELSKHCERLVGIDRHPHLDAVGRMLANEGVSADLRQCDLLALPFGGAEFDCVVCVSVLEFVDDVDRAMQEMHRVAAPQATIVVGAPVFNAFTDRLYDMVGFKRHKSAHKSDQNKILDAARRHFTVNRMLRFPLGLPLGASLFFALQLSKAQ